MSLTSKHGLTLWLIVGLVTTGGWAQEAGGSDQEVTTALASQMKQTIVSVDFLEAPMEDVITALSSQADIDMIKSPEVTGLVTAKLTDVPLDEALESILAVHGFGYTASNSVIRIMPLDQLEEQKIVLVSKMYRIAYADIKDVAGAVEGILSEHGQMAINEVSNHLMVTDTDDRLAMVDRFVDEADREIPQILVEARVYDVSCSDYQDIGFDWSAGTYTIYDSDTGLATSGQLNPFGQMAFESTYQQTSAGDGTLRLGILDGDLDMDVTLHAIRDNVKARLLASPSILVLDNEQANIKIVSEIPYQELTQTAGGGNIGTTRFKEVGVELKVRPRVTRDDKVRLAINPVFSVQTGTVSIAIPTSSSTISSPQPIVDRREALTQALIKSGQTVVIGGLRKSDEVEQTSKVPLLGDFPILGELFKYRSQKTVNSELVVFITPRIIRDLDMSNQQQEKYSQAEEGLKQPTPPNNDMGEMSK